MTDSSWATVARPIQSEGWFLLEIPAGTIFFRGLSVYVDDQLISEYHPWLTSLNPACFYAFASDFQKGEKGKVITVINLVPLRILDMSVVANHAKLRSLVTFPTYREMDILRFAYEDGTRRRPHLQMDRPVAELILRIDDFDGYGYRTMPGSHDEVVLNKKVLPKLQRTPAELRFRIEKYKEIFYTWEGEIRQVIEEEKIASLPGPFRNVKFSIFDRYDPDPNKTSDRFLC